MSETKTKNLCTVPAADLNDSQYFIAEDGGELKRIPKAQVVLKKLEKMLATDTENLAGGGEVTAQELLDALAEQVANKLLAKSQVVNNLLATVEGNPLDATQGKALKELIDTTNNNLSKWKFQGDTIQFDVGTNSEAPLFFKIRSTETDFYQLTALSGGLELSKTENGAWTSLWKAATKSDLPKYKDVPIDLSTLTFSPNIGGYVCITKIADLIGTFTTVLSATVVRWSNLTSDTSVMLDGSGSYLTIRQDTDSKKGNITVRFVYV